MSETTDTTFVQSITDDEIDNAHTDALRDLATRAGLSGYETHETVAEIKFATEVITSPGALTAVDKALTALRTAYTDAGRGPTLDQRYSGTVELRIWQTDENLRQSITYARERAQSKSE